jgi:hypothetical protein
MLTPGGWIAFQMTNEHLDLRPVVEGIAADLHASAVVHHDDFSSRFAILAR